MKKLNRIVLIDDDGNTNIYNEFILKKTKAINSIHKFKNPIEALNYVCTNNSDIDLILLDLNMPEMNGWEFLNIYEKANNKKAPVVILTSSINKDDVIKSKNYRSVKQFENKPLSINNITKIIERVVFKTM